MAKIVMISFNRILIDRSSIILYMLNNEYYKSHHTRDLWVANKILYLFKKKNTQWEKKSAHDSVSKEVSYFISNLTQAKQKFPIISSHLNNKTMMHWIKKIYSYLPICTPSSSVRRNQNKFFRKTRILIHNIHHNGNLKKKKSKCCRINNEWSKNKSNIIIWSRLLFCECSKSISS